MNKKKIKILGSGPTGSLLALNLASSNCEIDLIEPLNDLELTLKDKGYAITQSSRRIFEELGLWTKLKEYTVGFSSLSIIDDVLSNSALVRKSDLKNLNKEENNIGWVIEHKHLMAILLNSIKNNNYINKLKSDRTHNNSFDFVLAADGRDSLSRKKWKIYYYKSLYNQRCISFRAVLKQAPRKRAYEIFRHEGPLALLPLENNIYQIIWFSSIAQTKSKLQLTNHQLLKRLESILPDKIKAESIVSEISNYSIAKAFAFPKFSKFREMLVGDSAHSFHPVGGQGLNACIRDIYELCNMIRKYEQSSIIYQRFFSLIFFLKRFSDIFSLIIFTDFLIRFFSNRSIILYPFRSVIFYMLRKFKFLRVQVFSLMTDSIKRYKSHI